MGDRGTVEALEAENADLRSTVAQVRRYLQLLTRLLAIPSVARAAGALSDDDLAAAGFTASEVASMRDFASPLPNFSWLIEGQVAACGRPRGPAAIGRLVEMGVTTLVSLTQEPLPEDWLGAEGVRVVHLPVPDFVAPTQEQLENAVDSIEGAVASGGAAAVHCTAGWGRTGTVLAALLVSRGARAEDAIVEVRRQRPGSIETPGQEAAVREFAASRGV